MNRVLIQLYSNQTVFKIYELDKKCNQHFDYEKFLHLLRCRQLICFIDKTNGLQRLVLIVILVAMFSLNSEKKKQHNSSICSYQIFPCSSLFIISFHNSFIICFLWQFFLSTIICRGAILHEYNYIHTALTPQLSLLWCRPLHHKPDCLIFRSTDFDLWPTGLFQDYLFECRFGDILWSSVDSAVGAELHITASVPSL